MATPSPRSGDLISGINVTPLVDVVLVLLIVLMVSAQYVASQAIPMELPKAASGESAQAEPLAIGIDASGTLFLNGERLSKPQLRERIQARGRERSALIAADGATPHRAIVAVIDILRSEGVSKVAFNVAPEAP